MKYLKLFESLGHYEKVYTMKYRSIRGIHMPKNTALKLKNLFLNNYIVPHNSDFKFDDNFFMDFDCWLANHSYGICISECEDEWFKVRLIGHNTGYKTRFSGMSGRIYETPDKHIGKKFTPHNFKSYYICDQFDGLVRLLIDLGILSNDPKRLGFLSLGEVSIEEHIKLMDMLNENKNQLSYHKITDIEYDKYFTKSMPIETKADNTEYLKILNMIPHSTYKVYPYGIIIILKNPIILDEAVTVTELPDKWFLIGAIDRNSKREQKYKCDQLDGVIDLLKYLKIK